MYNHLLGYLLNAAGETFQGDPEDEIYFICDNLEAARRYARDASERMPHVVCVLLASDGTELEFIASANAKTVPVRRKPTWFGQFLSKIRRR
ncbi:MAG: hypothetical protein R3B13_18510 [Polyangiaceae bacterium]